MPGFTAEDVYVSYLPMPHVYEHCGFWLMTLVGGRIGVFAGDVKKLKYDMQALNPTCFPSVPRLYNKIYDNIKISNFKHKCITFKSLGN